MTTLASSAAPARVLAPVTLGATILGLGGGAPNGTVDFREGTTSLGTALLDPRGVSRAFAGGALHTCAINTGGGVKCWGLNDHGQLGDNSVTNRTSPTPVYGLTSGIVALAAGDNHTCAVTTTGGVECWGSNYIGQLGNYSNVTSLRSVDVQNLGASTVTALAAGTDHTCAVTTTGGVECWGGGIHGRLGDGSGSDQWAPVDVFGLTSGVVAIAAAGERTCALTASGGMKCWGYNARGEVGDGTTTNRYTPVDVSGLTSGVASISAGLDHTCAVTTGGAVSCWGNNDNGMLGDGTTTIRTTPTAVSGLTSDIVAVAAGSFHTCALRVDGFVLCWGFNAYGELGNGTTASSSIPVAAAPQPGGFVGITVGGLNSCAFDFAGTPWCWGDNAYGEIGDGTNAMRPVPTILPSLTTAVASRATLTTASLPIGSHTLTAVYATDGIHDASTSAALTQVITGFTTTTTLSTSKATTFTGESVTFTATLADPGGAFSGGSVTFRSDGSTIGVVNVASGTASLSTASLAVGPHAITAVYGGDSIHAGSTSASLSQTVVGGGTATSLVASASTVTVGDPVTFTATVAPQPPAGGSPDGSVTFTDGTTFSTTMAVVNAQASLTVPSLIWGTHTVTATYSGSASYGGSVSPPVPVTSVLPTLATTTTLSVSPPSILIGEEATLTTTVTAPGAVPVGGSVVFAIDGTPFAQRVIGTGATATAPVSTTALGNHTLTAAYTGSTIGPMFFFTASISPTVPLSVVKAPTTTSLASSASPIAAGQPIAFTAFVQEHGKGRPTGTVTFKNGTYAFATAPLETVGVNRSIADGESHSCALTQAGGVACWGSNAHGELGDGTTVDHLTPMTIDGLSGIAAVAVGRHHVCALTESGGVKCWGDNSSGQLGDGTTSSRSTPVSVKGSGGADLGDIAAIAAGGQHTCALARSGGMLCWGANAYHRLGTATASAIAPPSAVTNLNDVVAITAGTDHTCALTTAGGMKCWGSNDHGQLGIGSDGDRTIPTDVMGLTSGVAAITAGDRHGCAVTTAGGVMCWGANGSGQTGSANGPGDGIPRLVPPLTGGVVSVTAGDAHTCAVLTDGSVACWGENENGQLGNGTVADSNVPVAVLGLTPGTTLAVAAGSRHGCAVLVDASEMCWGADGSGQIGDGTTDDGLTPVPVGGLRLGLSGKATVTTASLPYGNRTIAAVYGGDGSFAATTSAAATVTITRPVLATTTTLSVSPTSLRLGATVTLKARVVATGGTPTGDVAFSDGSTTLGSATLAAGTATLSVTAQSLGTRTLTAVYAGDSTGATLAFTGSNSPPATSTVDKATSVARVASSASPSAGGSPVTLSATVTGRNGAVPGGTIDFRDGTATITTVALVGVGAGRSFGGGMSHACFLTAAGGVKCAGRNGGGQLGDGTNVDSTNQTVDVVGLASGVVAITAGVAHSCALTATGAVKCWGNSENGRLGDGANATSLVPVAVSGLASGVVSLSAGSDYTCAVSTDGGAKCWGNFSSHQIPLPIPSTYVGRVPTDVPGLSLALHATARTTTSALAVGWRPITAAWNGDATHDGTTSVAFSQRITALPTTTALVSSKAPSTWGDSVTFTATVAGSGARPAGTVDFLLDGTSLGPVQLVDGVGRVTKNRIDVGSHTVRAVYAGDATHAMSTSAGLTQVVAEATTTVTAISLHDPTPFGSTTDFRAIVSSPVPVSFDRPTGTVTFKEGTTTLGTAAIADGVANFSTGLAVGSHAVVATYGGDDDFTGSTASTLNVAVVPAATTTTLVVTPAAPVFGQAVTLTATVGGAASPAGIVRFYDGATWLATKTLSGGVATHQTTTLAVGSHDMRTVYAGDANHGGSTSASTGLSIGKGTASVALTAGSAKVLPGTVVTLTAKVAPVAPATAVPQGSVAFKDGGTVLGTVALSGGTATLTTAALTTGTHAIVAAYLGSTSFAVANSSAATVAVDPRVGAEFRVATTTTGAQQASSTAALAAGGFVVGWVGDTATGWTPRLDWMVAADKGST